MFVLVGWESARRGWSIEALFSQGSRDGRLGLDHGFDEPICGPRVPKMELAYVVGA